MIRTHEDDKLDERVYEYDELNEAVKDELIENFVKNFSKKNVIEIAEECFRGLGTVFYKNGKLEQ